MSESSIIDAGLCPVIDHKFDSQSEHKTDTMKTDHEITQIYVNKINKHVVENDNMNMMNCHIY